MSTRPRIGVSCNFMHADPDRALFRGKALQYVETRMAKAVWRAGGHPILLTELDDPAATAAQMADVEGLLLTGGADVSPGSYGEAPMQPEWSGDAIRDTYEIDLIRRAEARVIPILGICRGVQIINTQIEGTLVHRDWHRYDQLGHDVAVTEGSWVSEVYGGATSIGVNSIHHQSIKDPPRGFTVTAVSPDGVLEAVESIDDDRFVVGVQWHPEWLEADRVATDPDAQGWADGGLLFRAFVKRCAR